MTDVAGVPIEQSQEIQIYFGGAFDATIMGAPVYFWVIFVMGMGLICGGILVAYYRFFILDKVWAFVECYKKKIPLALIRTRYRKAYMKSLKYIAQIFLDEDGPDKWFAPALETSSNLEGVDLIEAVDYFDWLQDPILNQTVFEIVQQYNAKQTDETKKIYDPIVFQEKLASGELAEFFDSTEIVVYKKGSVKLQAFFIVDMSKLERYLPKNRSSSMFGGYTQFVANELGSGNTVDWKSWVLPVGALCTLIIISSMVGYVILSSA